MLTSISPRPLRLALALAAVLTIAACSKADQTAGTDFGAAGGRGGAPGSTQDFAVNVGDRVFFESDSTDLTPTAVSTLDKQAAWLSRYPRYTFLVEGHADERGTREYNFSLGARRSQVVRDYLSSRGIAGSRIRTVSYGKERPVATCNDISCWSQNRRAVTVLDGGAGM
ncbi:MAG: peptidoglycan-associated lipoprotein Pal [Microvirga sp.]|jgi:peptidoglycan-associated lipoprotein